MRRDNITRERALLRINAQYDEQYYIDRSDYIIRNNGEDIKEQINAILEEIL
jgi:dephospho-CoA kinase